MDLDMNKVLARTVDIIDIIDIFDTIDIIDIIDIIGADTFKRKTLAVICSPGEQ